MKLQLIALIIIAAAALYILNPKMLKDKSGQVLSVTENSSCDACEKKAGYINQVQFIDQVFNYLSKNDKVVLKGNCSKQSFISPDIPIEIRSEIKSAMDSIVEKSNKLCCSYFLLKNSNLVMVEENSQGKRYVVDSMMHETNDHITIRFIVDFVIINGEVLLNYISVANTSVYNLRKHPANSSESANNMAKKTSEDLYASNGSQFDVNWMDRLDKLYNEKYIVVGLPDKTSLVSNPIDFVKQNNVFELSDMNKWIVPFDMLGRSSDFCKKHGPEWDRFSVQLATSTDDGCLMDNTAYDTRNVLPNDNPDRVGLVTEYGDPDNSKNGWLFNSGTFGNIHVETALG
jgi:hypothetical protein